MEKISRRCWRRRRLRSDYQAGPVSAHAEAVEIHEGPAGAATADRRNSQEVWKRSAGDAGADAGSDLIIKLVLFPLTLKQLKSMKAQQALQPQIAEIRKKYGKDQQAMLAQTQAQI